MDSTQKYIVWAIVAALVIGGGFFVYKKMHASVAKITEEQTAPIGDTEHPLIGGDGVATPSENILPN